MTIVCAGLAFGWSGVATKLASDDLSHGYLVVAIAWGLATAAASAVGVLSESSSLQARPAIQVAPVVFVTQTIVPVALAPVLFGERFSDTPLGGVPLALSLLLLVAGAAALVRSPLLLALMGGEPISHDSGSTPSPSPPSEETIRSTPATEEADPSTVDHQHIARPRAPLRQRARRVQAQRPFHGNRVGGARQQQLTDGQPAGGLQEVELVAQPQRARLGAQRDDG